MADPYLAGARIVAAFQSEYRRAPASAAMDLLVSTIADGCREMGLRPADIDGLAVSSFGLAPDNVVTVAEHLGVTLNWAWQGAHGGASGVVSVLQAAEAITTGRAEIVVCAAADSFTVASHMKMLETFNSAMRDYLAPYGFGGANGLFALVEREHRSLYGTQREQLGKIAVAQRRNAMRNQNALLRGPLTLEDYLTARTIADPVRLFDCVLPCEGADMVVLASQRIAATLKTPTIRVVAGGQSHNFAPDDVLSTTTGSARYAERMFATAEMTGADMDFVQLYDDYPIMVAIQLEDLGFCSKGEVGAFIDATDFDLEGDLPLNTGGGQLSCGQAGASGGMIGMFEAVRQLTHQAGGRQVRGAKVGLVSGFGMVGYGRGLSSASAILASDS
jgi:acetyl-CoA acetyltransferase